MRSKTFLLDPGVFRDTVKRYWWFAFIVLLSGFFSGPVFLVTRLRAIIQNEALIAQTLPMLLRNFLWGSASYVMGDLVMALIFGAAAGLVFFGFLHQKKQVDFYLGQPITRESLLTTRFAAGVALYAAGVLIDLLICCFILLGNGASAAILGDMLMRLLVLLLGFCAMFALSVLCAALTGNSFAHLEVGFLLSFGGSLLAVGVDWLCDVFFMTWPNNVNMASRLLSLPVHMCYALSEGMTGLNMLCYLAFALLSLGLAYLALAKRPAEAVGGLLAFPKLAPVFRALLCVLTSLGLTVMLFSGDLSEGLGMFIFGAAMGLFLGHIASQAQIKRSFAGMFSGWRALIITAVAMAAFLCCFALDPFGYDRYLPAREEVKAVSVDLFDSSQDVFRDNAQRLDNLTVEDPAVIDDALLLARAGIDAAQTTRGGAGRFSYTIRYTLGNGRCATRAYQGVDIAKIAEPLLNIERAPAYIAKNELLLKDAARCGAIALEDSGDGRYYGFNAAQCSELLAALRADVQEHGMAIDSPSPGSLSLDYALPEPYDPDVVVGYSHNYCSFPLRMVYTRTLALLQSWNITPGVVSESLKAGAKRVDIVKDADNGRETIYSTDDPARIAELLGSDALTRYNGLLYTEPYSLLVYDEYAMDTMASMDAEDRKYAESQSFGILYGHLTLSEMGVEP